MAGINFDITVNTQSMVNSLNKAKEGFKELMSFAEKAGISIDDLEEISEKASKGFSSIQKASDTIKELQSQIEAQNMNIESLNDQLEEHKKQLSQTIEELAKLREASKGTTEGTNIDEATKAFEAEKDAVQSITSEKAKAQAVVEALKGKIQSLKDEIISLIPSMDNLKSKISEGSSSFDEYRQKITNFLTGNGKFQESLGEMGKVLERLPAPLRNTAKGAADLTKALWTMAATPIGAALSAIVVALSAVYSWFKKSAEGQKAFAQISAYLGSILSSLSDVMVTLGKSLYHAFADADAPMNAFARGLKTSFVGTIKTVGELVGGLGTTLKGIFTLNWGTFKDGMSQMWKGVKEAGSTAMEAVGTAVKGVSGAVQGLYNTVTDKSGTWEETAGIFESMFSNAQKAAKLAERQLSVDVARQEAQQKLLKMESEISEKREKLYQLSGREKEAVIEELKVLEKQKFDKQIEAQREQLAIVREQNALHASSLDDLAKERDLETEIMKTEAQRAASTRTLVRMQEANRLSMANADKRNTSNANSISSAESKLSGVIYENVEERIKAEIELEQRVTRAKIEAMEEGAEKVRAQRESELKAELLQIENEREEAIEAERKRQIKEFEAQQALIKAHGGGVSMWNDSMIDNDIIDSLNEKYKKLAELAIETDARLFAEAEKSALNSYLSEYGTYQQKKLAIAEEYADKIKKANTEGERLSLEKQRDKLVKEIDISAVKNTIDWADVFGKFGKLMGEEVESNIKAIREYMKSDDFKNMAPIDQSQIVEAFEQLKKYAGGNFEGFSIKKIGDLVNEFQEAQKSLISAQQEETDAYKELEEAQGRYNKALKDGNSELAEAYAMELEMTRFLADEASRNVETMTSRFTAAGNQLHDATSESVEAINSLTNAVSQIKSGSLQEAYSGVKNLSKTLSTVFTGQTKKLLETISSSMGGAVGEILSAALGLLDMLKDGLGSLIADLTDMVFNAVDGVLSDFLSGDIITKPLKSAISGVSGLLDTITLGKFSDIIGNGESDSNLEKDLQRLTLSNKDLQNAIDGLADAMDKANMIDVEDIYSKQVDYTNQMMKNTQEEMLRSLKAYSNGTLGIGGSKSSRYSVDKGILADEWAMISSLIGKTVRDAETFFSLSSQEMWEVANELPSVYSKIKELSSAGHKDASKFMDEYISYWQQLENLRQTQEEKLTNTSFDTIRSDFKSALAEMDGDIEGFSNNMKEYMKDAVLESMMLKNYEPQLKKWYERFAMYMKSDGTIDEAERKALADEWKEIVSSGIEERNRLFSSMGWDDTSYSQKATSKAWGAMSQDTGEELNGRFTALQIAGESVNNNVSLMLESVNAMQIVSELTRDTLLEIRNLSMINSGYLEDIRKYSKTCETLGERLDKIIDNTK